MPYRFQFKCNTIICHRKICSVYAEKWTRISRKNDGRICQCCNATAPDFVFSFVVDLYWLFLLGTSSLLSFPDQTNYLFVFISTVKGLDRNETVVLCCIHKLRNIIHNFIRFNSHPIPTNRIESRFAIFILGQAAFTYIKPKLLCLVEIIVNLFAQI
jgi:hypothetical protein